MAIFTDEEHRILLAAMGRETDLCKKIDTTETGVVSLTDICKSINRKIYSAQHDNWIKLDEHLREENIKMNIVDNRENKKVQFKELKGGDLFKYGNLLYMKVTKMEVQGINGYINCISPVDGTNYAVTDTTLVEKIKHKLVLE